VPPHILYIRGLILVALLGALDLYIGQSLRAALGQPSLWAPALLPFWVVNGFFYVLIIAAPLIPALRGGPSSGAVQALMAGSLSVVLPKLFLLVGLLMEDAVRGALGLFSAQTPERAAVYHQILDGTALALMGLMIYGVAVGRHRFRVWRVQVELPNLPPAFDGYRIVQLSDAHLGSFAGPGGVAKGLRLAQGLNPDVILFTGDLVNDRAPEALPYVRLWADLQAPDGKFSTLGNHDYGDYVYWPSREAKTQNLQLLAEIHQQMGFRLLRNEHTVLSRNGQQLYIVGVENWGRPPFPQYGDLDRATQGIPPGACIVLLSHDPSHWRAQVLGHPTAPALTLSGHTHGMQFGLELPGLRWSPVKLKYPEWAGLYHQAGRFLYVNRGFGYLAYPGRVGIWPEVTEITLRKKG